MGNWHLFEVIGIEIEYMIVDSGNFSVRPLADQLLQNARGEIVSSVSRKRVTWSNELVSHVLELKTTNPVVSPFAIHSDWKRNLVRAQVMLSEKGACLLPGAAHPFMNPDTETVIWPYEYNEIYATYDRIFNCKGHGWSNLQSVHINLPFHGDDEFGILHAAIRVALAILPAISAASPILDGQPTGWLDTRLKVYETNQKTVPEIAGCIIPEAVFTEKDYNEAVFEKVKTAIKPHDPEGILDPYFLNSRGAIARFDRGSIEIRILDAQECLTADLSMVEITLALVKALAENRWASPEKLRSLATHPLKKVFDKTAKLGLDAEIDSPELLEVLGMPPENTTAKNVWAHLSSSLTFDEKAKPLLDLVLNSGNLATRMLHFSGQNPDRTTLELMLGKSANCLVKDVFF